MFEPPRCPNRHCISHTRPRPGFCKLHGFYHAKCRSHPVPRFRCLDCRRTFSRQTFRADYRDHKPYKNQELMKYLISGIGLRQSARMLGMSLRGTVLKSRKICRHLRRVNVNLRGNLAPGCRLQLDELETYEARRRERPVTFPIILETQSRFVIWGESAELAPKGRMSKKRIQAIEKEVERHGPRKTRSNTAVRRTLDRAAALTGGHPQVFIQSDEKSSYPKLVRDAFPGKPVVHQTTNSKLIRNIKNPLFPINQTEAIARDLLGRLRRDSWLVSKKRRYLDQAFQAFMAWKNYVRPRYNGEKLTPAQQAGFCSRRYKIGELLGWRQDWYGRSLPVGARCA